MPHGLRTVALVMLVGAAGCTAPEKIAPTRISMPPLPPPNLPASPTGASRPAASPPDNRGKVTPPAAMPVLDGPNTSQLPAVSPPAAAGGNPALLPLSPPGTKVAGRDAPPVGISPVLSPPDLPAAPPPLPPATPIIVPALPASPLK